MKKSIYILLIVSVLCAFCSSCGQSNTKEERYTELDGHIDFGEGVYRPNPFKILDNIPPFSWMGMPDSVKKEVTLQITFNEDAIRSHSSGQIALVDYNGNLIKGVKIGSGDKTGFKLYADVDTIILPIQMTVNPVVGDSILGGSVLVLGSNLDQVNSTELSSMTTPIASWSLKHETGINWLRWLILILLIMVGLCILYVFGWMIYGIISGLIRSSSVSTSVGYGAIKRKSKDKNVQNAIIRELLRLEKKLYQNLMIYVKYDTLEKMRSIIDDLYQNNPVFYQEAREALMENTWDALEEAWKLWDPTPSSNVEWTGPKDRTCVLKSSHSQYKACKKLNFIECRYDEHGSPDFRTVTFPDSVVNVTDLYENLSSDNIKKRGGSPNSLQELAQEKMAQNLRTTIEKWAKQNGCDPDFYKWRDAHDLVPHEDTNCRHMRLVYRDAHSAFKHRGGVANVINIKRHFPNKP